MTIRRDSGVSSYVIVLHGWFSDQPAAGRKRKHWTIETRVWSATEGTTDYGIGNSLPATMSGIHRLAKIILSGD